MSLIAAETFSMISVWVMKSPRFSFPQKFFLLLLFLGEAGLGRELQDVVLLRIFGHGPIAYTNSSRLSCSTASLRLARARATRAGWRWTRAR